MADDGWDNVVFQEVKYRCGECRKVETDPHGRGWKTPEAKKKQPNMPDFESQGIMVRLCKACLQKHGLAS